MDNTSPEHTTDPVALIERLDAEEIRERLAELERVRNALLVLLRAALRNPQNKKVVAHVVS